MKRNFRRLCVTLLPGLMALAACSERDDLKMIEPDDVSSTEVAMSIGVSSASLQTGDQVGVALFSDAPTRSVGAVQGWLRFNPALLEYAGQVPNTETMVVVNDAKADRGELRLIAVAPRGLGDELARLSFRVKGAGYASGLRWETEIGTWTKNLDAPMAVRSLSELRGLEGFSAAAARKMTEADWGKLGYAIDGQQAGGPPIALAPLERAPILYGDANQSGPAGANLLNSSDVLKAARISVGIEECIINTATPGSTLADCVAANVAPENLPGLGEPADATPPGLDATGSFSRTINSSDVLSIARQSVGIVQAVAGQQIPVSVLCGTFGGLTQNIRSQTCAAAPADTAFMVPQGSGQDTVILGTMTLTGDKVWKLTRVVRFGDDGTQGTIPGGTGVPTAATLVVQPGARIEGSDSSAIVITRAGTIQAVGTPIKPIVFTCLNDAVGGRVPGCWGGVYLAGNAVLNDDQAGLPAAVNLTSIGRNNGGGPGVKQRFAEGFLPANLYVGGDKDNDSCGTIKYAIFAYGGRAVAPNNELNNLSLGACGSGTVLDFIQAHAGTDDGVEHFGGRDNITHLYLTANDDDNDDFSYGYDGNQQFVLVQQEAGDKGHEVDNNENNANYNGTPRTKARIWNFTLVGGSAEGTHQPTAMHYRRGTASFLNNGLVLSYNFGLLVDNVETCDQLPMGPGSTDVGAAGPTDDDLQFKWVLFIDVTNTMNAASCSDTALHPATEYRDIQIAAGLAGAGWETRAGMTAFPNREMRAPYDKFLPDFRPDVATTGGTPPAGFDATATYLGAFKPAGSGGNIPWSAGWTIGWQGASQR